MLLNISISKFGTFIFVVSSARFIFIIIIILSDSLKLSSSFSGLTYLKNHFFLVALWKIARCTFLWTNNLSCHLSSYSVIPYRPNYSFSTIIMEPLSPFSYFIIFTLQFHLQDSVTSINCFQGTKRL